ncbi:hypothetical protein GALMADRAFT_148388 [Galerina marginata CBS 339.88]|uniref:Glutamate synthase domain-containing protein n=1 Tax=Galerina marginata (strain CBS 339.88) TaxID=685588 RepID=A0A067S4N3_GALM3|nr:hypothetical protein GALMADRAFT_148388 [Galerina marginata CBS 339.88]
MDAFELQEQCWPSHKTILLPGMPESGKYHWPDGGEAYVNDPSGIAGLQDAAREKNQNAYDAYARNANQQAQGCSLGGLFEFQYEAVTPIPIELVQPRNGIVRRFVTGAMSCGSASTEAHSALAVGMNRLGGKPNPGEGGEDAERSQVLPDNYCHIPRPAKQVSPLAFLLQPEQEFGDSTNRSSSRFELRDLEACIEVQNACSQVHPCLTSLTPNSEAFLALSSDVCSERWRDSKGSGRAHPRQFGTYSPELKNAVLQMSVRWVLGSLLAMQRLTTSFFLFLIPFFIFITSFSNSFGPLKF